MKIKSSSWISLKSNFKIYNWMRTFSTKTLDKIANFAINRATCLCLHDLYVKMLNTPFNIHIREEIWKRRSPKRRYTVVLYIYV